MTRFEELLARALRAQEAAETNAQKVLNKLESIKHELAPDVQAQATLTYIGLARDLYREAIDALKEERNA